MRRTIRKILAGLAGAGLAAGCAAAVGGACADPAPVQSTVLAHVARAPGRPAHLAWPAAGQAALATVHGALIGAHGPDRPVPIASITKVMTAYLVLTDHPLSPGTAGPVITITREEAASLPHREALGQSLLAVRAGQRLSERQALDALLLASADNMAAVLARFDAGNVPAFVAKMNATAKTLRMRRTRFAGPSGFDPGSVSDATDLLRLARATMAIPAFAAIVSQPSATITGTGTIDNYNTLAGRDGFTGIKTGSTPQAGQALLFSATRTVAGRPVGLLGVVLDQHGPGVVGGALAAAKRLADSFYAAAGPESILPAGTPVLRLHAAGHTTTLTTTRALTVITLPGAHLHLSVRPGHPGAARVQAPTAAYTGHVQATGPVPHAGPLWRITHPF